MSDFTYFRIGVPNDMVADIMWHDDFEVSMEPVTLRAKPETNYQRYFGTPEKASETIRRSSNCEIECGDCSMKSYMNLCPITSFENLLEWMESEAE